jgi:excinuclease ABC subunit A
VHVPFKNRYGRERSYSTGFEGAIPFVQRRHSETESDWSRSATRATCARCPARRARAHGSSRSRWRCSSEAGRSPTCATCHPGGRRLSAGLDLTPRERQIAERVLKEIQARLGFLLDVGLEYLSLDRAAGTLSGGEAQRIRLATQIGSGLVGVLYVLDEPSIGLHQRDNRRLIETLTRLRDLGNTLIVVEHDEDTIRTPTGSSTSARARRARRAGRAPGRSPDLLTTRTR